MPNVRRNSCEKIMGFGFGHNAAKMQRGTVDRISELPEFILHNILSMLDTKEVCRASVLSKRWYDVWSSIPVLDFQLQCVKGYYDTDAIQSFLGFIDKAMERYFTQKYRIRKLNLELPKMDFKINPLVNKWLNIAVENQIEELKLKILQYIDDLGKISLPWTRKVNEGTEFVDSMQSNFKASPLRKFAFNGRYRHITWPWNMNVVVLKNLRRLEIVCAPITDDIFSELVHGLVALESLLLDACAMLKCIKVSSISLKVLKIIRGLALIQVAVDAPNLLEFWYNCELKTPLLLSRVLDHCDAQFFPLFVKESITTVWLVKLKKFLVEANSFKSLSIELSESFEIEVEEEQLRNVVTGPSYKLKELKLCERNAWNPTESSLPAFVDGLFWCCHPDILSICCSCNSIVKSIFRILKGKVQCYKHPLRSIEIEGVDTSNFLSEPSKFEIRFRLSWF